MCYNKLIRFLIHRKELFMAVCYKKLWKLLIDKNMNKTELRMASGITTTALAKLGRDENVNTEVLAKICKTLDCKIEDIMELVPECQE
jgi:DNA-binding Xre family transcriptional regulator